MLSPLHDELPLPQKLALTHCPATQRKMAIAAFALDARLGKFVAQASEPLVAQLRLAWWREQLTKPARERPAGDTVLDLIGNNWEGRERDLVALVDGWERLLGEPPLPEEAVDEFIAGRARIFVALAGQAGGSRGKLLTEAERAGRLWALADLSNGMSDRDEREFVLSRYMGDRTAKIRLPYRHRHLTILGELGRRVLLENGGDLLSQRRDYGLISRIGLLGF